MTENYDPSRQGSYGGPPPTGPYSGEPQAQYPAAPNYPQPYGQVGYPGYGYPPAPGYGYGYPPVPLGPQGPRRPGLVIAAAVMGYINAGLLILAGFLLLFGASIINDIEDAVGSGTDYATEAAVLGIFDFVAAGLIIAGAVMFTGAATLGRLLLTIGNGLVVGLTIYWFVRFTDDRFNDSGGGLLFWGSLFAILAILSLAFSFSGQINRWLREQPV